MTPSLIVSLHDVSPQTFEASRRILHDLAGAGIQKTSLLVIPNHHHRGHFLDDSAFCDWLRTKQNEGHEIVTHGYFHQRERSVSESTRVKMITRFYTAGEGEFYDIDEQSAAEKMNRAQTEFARIDLHPTGFIAPAWLLGAGAERAAKQIGFHYTTTLQEIRLLQPDKLPGKAGLPPASPGMLPGEFSPRIQHSQSLVYSVRSAWRRIVSIAWNRLLLARLTNNSVARLGIHPPDWKYTNIRSEILRIASYLARIRNVTTYAEWTSR